MAYKVIVDYIGIPHFYAQCQVCSWSWENHREREKGIREIKKHVAKTGHTVSLEKAVCTEYVAAQQTFAPDPPSACPDCGSVDEHIHYANCPLAKTAGR